MIDNNQKYEKLRPEDFEFVQQDERIFDKKFETKPIGYFKDAMIRFSRNRTNVIATIILGTLILLSILVPILTTKNYTKLQKDIAGLPPRVPLLEKLGILDGKRKYEEQIVDLDTIDEETGLGYPKGFNPKYIVEGTLKNYEILCQDSKETCRGGTNIISTSGGKLKYAIYSAQLTKDSDPNADDKKREYEPVNYPLIRSNNPIFVIDIESFKGENPALNVLISLDGNKTFTPIKTLTTPGRHIIEVYKEIDIKSHGFNSQLRLEFVDEKTNSQVVLNSVALYRNGLENEPYRFDDGFSLSLYQPVSGEEYSGVYYRNRGKTLYSSFKYDVYGAALDEKIIEAMSKDEYNKILAANPDVCIPQDDPENPDPIGKIFPEGCPIKKLVKEVGSAIGPDGEKYSSYTVIVDNARYLGFDSKPYFLFGTDMGGRDYFALIWMGLRTSLLMGVIIATINISIGVIYGSIEGYYGGTVDLLMERFSEIAGKVPWLVWLAIFVVIFGPGIETLILVLTVTGWLGIAATTRAQFYRYKGREYVLASRTLGAKDMRIIFRHILPNGLGTIITSSILSVPTVIFSESTISYLGYGLGRGSSIDLFGIIKLTGTSIGVLLAEGRIEMTTRPYLVFFPSIIIAILMITFNMFGNALRDAFNPTLRGSE